MTDAEIIKSCIDQCRNPKDEWHWHRAQAQAYVLLRRGRKESDWPAWNAVEAARRIGEWLRTA